MKYKILSSLCLLLLCANVWAQSNITQVEYFIDQDPGIGLGTQVSITPSTNITNLNIAINTTILTEGVHTFQVRAQDANGLWSLVNTKLFYKPYSSSGSSINTPLLTKIEYFIDTDPGFGAATNIPFSSGTDINNVVVAVDPGNLSEGIHTFTTRAIDANGNWSLSNTRLFYKPYNTSGNSTNTPLLTKIEYFIDTDPGLGAATNIPFSSGTDINNVVVAIDPSNLNEGIHTFTTRAMDANGNWSLSNTRLFYKPYNTSGTSPILSNISKIEYYIDTDPGYGLANNVSFTPGTNAANIVIPINPSLLSPGEHVFYLRTMDANGVWSLVNSYAFESFANAVSSTPLLLNGFNADVIAEIPNNALGSTNNAFDFNDWVLMSQTYNASGISYLPNDGIIPSYFRPGVSFQLQPYNGNNSLRIGNYGMDSLIVNTPVAAQDIYLLGAATSWNPIIPSSFDMTITFTDNSTETITSLNMPDWFGAFGDYAIKGIGRTYRDVNNNIENSLSDPRLYSLKLTISPANQNKSIQQFNFTNTHSASTVLHIMAISVGNSCAGTPNPGNTLSSADSVCSGSNFMLSLQNSFFGSGTSYQWQRANDLAFTMNVENLGNAYTQTTQQDSLKYYRCAVSCGGGATVMSTPKLVSIFDMPTVSISATNNTICNGDSIILQASGAFTYTWMHTTDTNSSLVVSPTQTTTYSIIGTDIHGCIDSSALSIEVNATSSSTLNVTACDTYTWNGITYNTSNCSGGVQALDGSNHYYRYATVYDWDCCLFSAGIYETPPFLVDGHFKVEYDCDGIGVVIESTGGFASLYPVGTNYNSSFPYSSNPVFASLITNAGCCNADGSAIYVELSNERIPPAYTLHFTNSVGCDSSATLNLSLHSSAFSSENIVTCDSFLWYGNIYTTSGLYTHTILNSYGCVHEYHLNLTINYSSNIGDTVVSACEQFTWNGTTYTNSGSYTFVSTNANGCNNTAILQLSIHPLPFVTAFDTTACSLAPIWLTASPSGGVFSVTNPYTGPSTTYTYTYTDNYGCTSTSLAASITIINATTYYHDVDNDGYGNTNDSTISCDIPSGYVSNANDCNDADSIEHPNQIWYTDFDQDHYGTGNYFIQCSRPPNAFSASELYATAGDCNDYDANIRPGAQYFVASNSATFPGVLVSPLSGNSATTFQFEVSYIDSNNNMPPPGYPRIVLDYEGNGNYNDIQDRTIIMIPFDINDTSTNNGKKYIASISGLSAGTSWKLHAESNTNGCTSILGAFDYPDVLLQPDIEIFANDISFSSPNPAVLSQLIVSAQIHNESGFPAQNFIVHLSNQFDTTLVYPNITIPYLAANSSTSISWTITTPPVPSWCPMKVDIDFTNVITETNELDNSAIRPFVNGNYNLPGGIHSYPFASPAVQYIYPGAYIQIGGSANYYGTAVPMVDSSVAGATVNFTIVETGANYSTQTNSSGNFSYYLSAPLLPGNYHVVGTVTDFTLTSNFTTEFEMVATNALPDLAIQFQPTQIQVGSGGMANGSIIITNYGTSNSIPVLLDISNTGGATNLNDVTIPSLAPGDTFIYSYSVQMNSTGNYNVCATIDPNNILNESIEWNNTACNTIDVIDALPDIIPLSYTYNSQFQCQASSLEFNLYNAGGMATGSFACVIDIYLDGVFQNSIIHTVPNIPSVLSGSNYYTLSLPFTPSSFGNYMFTIHCDSPGNVIAEFNETNNTATYSLQILPCKANLTLGWCEDLNVESLNTSYTQGSNITLRGKIYNNGNLDYNGPVDIRWELSGGSFYNQTILLNLPSNTNVEISKVINAPLPGTQVLHLIVDPNNTIDESDETDNSISNAMCWDFSLVDLCGYYGNFWNAIYQQYQTTYLSIGISNPNLYDADTLKIKFEVSGPGIVGTMNLGYAFAYNVGQTCYCPITATLPANFAFQNTGTYTFTMTIDPDNQYQECDENNNVLVREVIVSDLPDMQELSQFIAPSNLNPAIGQAISMNITYENIGRSNQNDQMSMKVFIDNNLFATIAPINGLIQGLDSTISIPNTYSSLQAGVHVIEAVIDADNQITEYNENNNSATRSFIVGESANLHFKSLRTLNLYPALNSNVNIRGKIENEGDLTCAADVQFYYVNNSLDTLFIGTKHIVVSPHDSINVIQPWIVVDNKTTIIGKIVNSSIQEYNYDDNDSSFQIGQMTVLISSTPACGIQNLGTITANVNGGEAPYSYFWNTGYVGSTLTATVGNYQVVVSDATGQTYSIDGDIIACPPAIVNTKLYLQGYYTNSGMMTPAIFNQGEPSISSYTDTVLIELHDTTNGFGLIEFYKGILHTDGTIESYFSPAVNGNAYYLVVRHRNSITTWSANPVVISTVTNYDFSNAASKAYGDNQIEIESGVYAIYSGDLNQDENMDLLDMAELETDIANFQFGYFGTDINGDGNVDLLDSPPLEINVNNFIYSVHP